MKPTAALLTSVLGTVSALPQHQPNAKPIDLGDGITLIPRIPGTHRVRRTGHHTSPNLPTPDETNTNPLTNTTHAEYSTNWAGAILPGVYKSVTGTITIPTPRTPPGGSSSTQYAASAWVGIDGYTCADVIIQAGIDAYIHNGAVRYDAWYEWWPALAYSFSGFPLRAGDSVAMTVTVSSSSGGEVTLRNNSQGGKSVTHAFQGEGAKLCRAEAEWIVEDFQMDGEFVPVADFGSVSFKGAAATKEDGSAVGVAGARILDLRKDGNVLTSCSTSGSSTVKCSYK